MPAAGRYSSRGNDFAKIARESPQLRRTLDEFAGKAKAHAEEISQDFRETGDYVDSFESGVEEIDWKGRYPGTRMAGVVRNTSGHAAAVEFGNEHVKHPHRVLGRTLEWLDEQ